MNAIRILKDNVVQVLALIEINIKLNFRFKFNLIMSLIMPIIGLLMPLIIMSKFFEFNAQFGPWTEENFMVYQLLAYNILLLNGVIHKFITYLNLEKYWKTFPALIIAPFNRFNLLLGIIFSHIIIISIPFVIILIITYIYYPIFFLTIIFIIFVFFLIALLLSGIGLIIGIFVISNENIYYVLNFIINLVIWLSCITYPFQIFPGIIQNFINLNPLYYAFSFVRLAWIENNVVISIQLHFLHFLILVLFSTIVPITGVYIFNHIYKRYGIVGY